MKIIFSIVTLIILAIVIYFFVLGVISKSAEAPGIAHGKLTACPNKPNCVSSEAGEDDAYSIASLLLENISVEKAMAQLEVIINTSGAEIVKVEENYIAATYTSSIFRFVDDLEIRLDVDNKTIHFRSASRVGHSDFGVNRKRVEELKKAFIQTQSN